MKPGHMISVEPSFVLYALHLGLGGCLRAHALLCRIVEPPRKEKRDATNEVPGFYPKGMKHFYVSPLEHAPYALFYLREQIMLCSYVSTLE